MNTDYHHLEKLLIRYREICQDVPDFMGFELAYHRGNITVEEFEDVKDKIQRLESQKMHLIQDMEDWSGQHFEPFEAFLSDRIKFATKLKDFFTQQSGSQILSGEKRVDAFLLESHPINKEIIDPNFWQSLSIIEQLYKKYSDEIQWGCKS